MLKKLVAWYKNRVEENDALRDKMFEEECEPEEQGRLAPDISEPVLSFVETFKRNPRRFSMSVESPRIGGPDFYTLLDKFTKESFSAMVVLEPDYDNYGYTRDWISYPTLLTKDEWEYVLESLSSYYTTRHLRLIELNLRRKINLEQRERNRLTEIYKGGGHVSA